MSLSTFDSDLATRGERGAVVVTGAAAVDTGSAGVDVVEDERRHFALFTRLQHNVVLEPDANRLKTLDACATVEFSLCFLAAI